jgi:AAA-like domain
MPDNPFQISGYIDPKKFIGPRVLAREISDNLCRRNSENSYGIVGGHLFGRSSFLRFLENNLLLKLKRAPYGDLHVFPVYAALNGLHTFDSTSDIFGFILNSIRNATYGTEKAALDLGLPEYTQISPSGASLQELEAFIAYIVREADRRFGKLRVVLLIDDADRMLNFSWTSTIFGNLHYLIHDGDVRSSIRLVLAGSRAYIDADVNGSPLNTSIIGRFLVPFTEPEAYQLIRRAKEIPSEVAQEVILQSGGHPYILQHILYYLFQDNIKLSTVKDVDIEVKRFIQDKIAVLRGWWEKIGEDGRRVYSIMRDIGGWVRTIDISKTANDPSLQVDVGLNALYSHGFVIPNRKDGSYCICGQLFYEWSESRCQVIKQNYKQIIKKTIKEIIVNNKSNQGIPAMPISTTNELAGILARQAVSLGGDPKEFFRRLVLSVDMPEAWRLQIYNLWTEDVKDHALQLIDWARSKGINPNDPNPRFTLLGIILNELLKYIGRDEARVVAGVIISYQLCLDEHLREEIGIKYRVPQGVLSLGRSRIDSDA